MLVLKDRAISERSSESTVLKEAKKDRNGLALIELWKKPNLINRYKKCVWRAILTPVIGKMSPRSTFLGLSKNSSCIS